MSLAEREGSRASGDKVELYLIRGAEPTVGSLLESVTMIPGTTEFGYGTTKVTVNGQTANSLSAQPVADIVVALDDLQACVPALKRVSLVVAWHGTDLRLSHCQIKPKVERTSATDSPYAWRSGPLTRGTAERVSYTPEGDPAVGGAPADRSIFEAIQEIKSRGLKVTLYPFILMDVAPDNLLPSPYGEPTQPAYPWRGRITCHPAAGQPGTVDKTPDAAAQVEAFFGEAMAAHFGWDASGQHVTYSGPAEWGMRRFILHMARIAVAAGGVDDFLIGSELVGLTQVRSSATDYPAVTAFRALAAQVRTMLGPTTKISYAADWSEYHSHRPADGSGDVFFHLDPLWADSNIDYVAIDNYLPLSDWRDGTLHLDRASGWTSIYDLDYLRANIEGGEYFDWFYASPEDRDAQVRTPITDGAYGEPWVYRQKDLRSWWNSPHHNRVGGVRQASPTEWVPQSKQIVFTEFGCAAVNKATNQPNVFVDPKSSESFHPHHSNGNADDVIQRAYLTAMLTYWEKETPRQDVPLPETSWSEFRTEAGAPGSGVASLAADFLEAGECYWPKVGDGHLLDGALYDASMFSINSADNPAGAWGEPPFDGGFFRWRRSGGAVSERPAGEDILFAVARPGLRFIHRFGGAPALTDRFFEFEVVSVPLREYDADDHSCSLYVYARYVGEATALTGTPPAMPMVDKSEMTAWTWDARPFPAFPDREDYWSDAPNYARGHWLNGRLAFGQAYAEAQFGPFAFTTAEQPIVRDGITYLPAPISRDNIRASGSLDKTRLEVTIGRGFDLVFDGEFIAYPPSTVVNLTVFQGHVGDDPDDPRSFTAVWAGRVLGAAKAENATKLTCEPIVASLRRPGLRRNYQRGCPYALFGPECRASRVRATYTAKVASVLSRARVTFTAPLPGPHAPEKFAGGILTWTNDAGGTEFRTIVSVPGANQIQLRGTLPDLMPGSDVQVTLGCNRSLDDCSTLHQNVLNYGGQPWIPIQNPLGPTNQFF